TYQTRSSPIRLSSSVSRIVASVAVMSIAVTQPSGTSSSGSRFGLCSDFRAACAASPIVPSDALERLGHCASTSRRNCSSDGARNQLATFGLQVSGSEHRQRRERRSDLGRNLEAEQATKPHENNRGCTRATG